MSERTSLLVRPVKDGHGVLINNKVNQVFLT